MNLIEFIGFIIVMLAMIILFAKRSWEERQRRKNPEKYAAEQEEQERVLRQFLHSLEGEEEKLDELVPKEPPPPPPEEEEVLDAFDAQMELEKLQMRGMERKMFHSPGEKDAYLHFRKQSAISASQLLGANKQNLRKAIVLKEILDKPKGL